MAPGGGFVTARESAGGNVFPPWTTNEYKARQLTIYKVYSLDTDTTSRKYTLETIVSKSAESTREQPVTPDMASELTENEQTEEQISNSPTFGPTEAQEASNDKNRTARVPLRLSRERILHKHIKMRH